MGGTAEGSHALSSQADERVFCCPTHGVTESSVEDVPCDSFEDRARRAAPPAAGRRHHHVLSVARQ
jgi:hypothetical protein